MPLDKKGGIGGFQHMEQAYVQLDNFWLHVLYAFLFLVWPYYSVKYLNKSQYSYIYPIVFSACFFTCLTNALFVLVTIET